MDMGKDAVTLPRAFGSSYLAARAASVEQQTGRML